MSGGTERLEAIHPFGEWALAAWRLRGVIPAKERVKKSKSRQKPLFVMAVLDTAIQEKAKHFNVALDGRVEARP